MAVREEEVVLAATVTVTDPAPLGPLVGDTAAHAALLDADHAVSLLIVRVTVPPVSATLSVGAAVTVRGRSGGGPRCEIHFAGGPEGAADRGEAGQRHDPRGCSFHFRRYFVVCVIRDL